MTHIPQNRWNNFLKDESLRILLGENEKASFVLNLMNTKSQDFFFDLQNMLIKGKFEIISKVCTKGSTCLLLSEE